MSILQRFMGWEVTCIDEFEVEKGMLKRFAIAVGDPNPVYYDEAFARTTAYGGIIAPPTFLFEWNHHRHSAMPHEELRSTFSSLESQPRILRGGTEYEFFQPVRPGDIIKTKSRITDVYEKQGKVFGQMVFMACETNYFNQKEESLGKSKETMIILP